MTSEQSGNVPTTLSTEARAQLVLRANNVTFDCQLHVFNVKGLSGTTRVVTLFPKLTCSCPSTGDHCYHIAAAKLSIGMNVSMTQMLKRNFTQLRKNTRSRKEKKCGRKRPRPYDIEGI